MGRLLRKRPSFTSKKKVSSSEEVNVSENSSSESNSVASAAPVPEKKRRPVAIQKAARPPIAFPGREYFEKVTQFLREVRVELRKVTWPSRKQTVGSTVVVAVLVLVLSLFLGVVDIGLSSLARLVLQ